MRQGELGHEEGGRQVEVHDAPEAVPGHLADTVPDPGPRVGQQDV